MSELCRAYYNDPEYAKSNCLILDSYLKGSKEDLWEFVRMGYVSAIGVLPDFILGARESEVITTLIAHSLTPAERKSFFAHVIPAESSNVNNWAEARRDSVKALINVVLSLSYERIVASNGRSFIDQVSKCLLIALQEYTIDNRGDIGAWVREASMEALFKFVTTIPHELLGPNTVHAIVSGLMQQAVERIDRTRAVAGKLFSRLIHQ